MRFKDHNRRGLFLAETLANSHTQSGQELIKTANGLYRKKTPHRPWVIALNEEAALASLAWSLRAVFEASTVEEAVGILNGILLYSQARPVITRHDADSWHLHFADDNSPNSSLIGATAATALAMLLCDTGLSRIGSCADPDCSRVFIDVSRNNGKKYCSTRCSTRASVAAHRERQRGPGPGPAAGDSRRVTDRHRPDRKRATA